MEIDHRSSDIDFGVADKAGTHRRWNSGWRRQSAEDKLCPMPSGDHARPRKAHQKDWCSATGGPKRSGRGTEGCDGPWL